MKVFNEIIKLRDLTEQLNAVSEEIMSSEANCMHILPDTNMLILNECEEHEGQLYYDGEKIASISLGNEDICYFKEAITDENGTVGYSYYKTDVENQFLRIPYELPLSHTPFENYE